MKNKIRLTAAVLALCTAISGCTGVLPEESTEPSPSTVNTRPKTTVQTEPTEPTSPSGYKRADFVNGGTIISVNDGEYCIDRLTRAEEKPMSGADWTVLLYICGSDLESENQAAVADLTELLRVECGDGINFVIQTGGSKSWSDNLFDSEKSQRFVNSGDGLELVEEFGLSNMGEADTLSDFISWGAENYPAENMGLVLWNHGGGSISGVCFDECFDYDSLTLPELDKALNASYDSMTAKFEFIGFDACLMATLETANILVPYANYMIGSQENEPGSGWDYATLTSYLSYNPDASGAQLGEQIGEAYFKRCQQDWSDFSATFSVVDLSKIDPLVEAFNKTAKEMYEDKKFIQIVKAINEADSFGGNNRNEGYSNMVDLGNMMDKCDNFCRSADDTIDLLEDAVVYLRNGDLHEDATGLSVYYPLAVQGTAELSAFADICPSTYYLAFVDKAAYAAAGNMLDGYDNAGLLSDSDNIWNIDYSGVDYTVNTYSYAAHDTDTSIPVSNAYFTNSGSYTVKLGDTSNLRYAACSLFRYEADGGVSYFGMDDDVVYDLDRNLLADNFDGTWLSLPDGQPLAIEVVAQKDDYSIYTCEVMLNDKYTNLRIDYSWDDHTWSVSGVWTGVDSLTGMSYRDIGALKAGDVIQPVYVYTDVNDEEWYDIGYKYKVEGDVKLSYKSLPAGDYAYCMTLFDIYGNWYFTPYAIFAVDYYGGVSYYKDSLVF